MPKFSTIKHTIQRAPAQLAHKASHAGSRVKALASSALESIRHPLQRRGVTADVLVEIDSNDWTHGNDNPLFEPAKTNFHNKLFVEIKADRSNAEDDAGSIEDPDKKPVRTIAFNRASLLEELDSYFKDKDEDEPKAVVARPESRGQGVASASEIAGLKR